ncbi:thymidine kinase [Candidatus Babeliales bacterium]|nr:thymidine kinase [Candidatus Babeliales bacterium]
MRTEASKKGRLEVICGSMFSGKSEELILRLRRAQFAKQNAVVFKHSLDDRVARSYITTHNGSKFEAIPIEHPSTILSVVDKDTEVIAIDEVQFFNNDIINIVCQMVDEGRRVIVAGLDLDFRGVPFGPIPTLMAVADQTTKLKAICMVCGKDAHFSQRLINGEPANYEDPIVIIGAENCYQARCRSCHQINRIHIF